MLNHPKSNGFFIKKTVRFIFQFYFLGMATAGKDTDGSQFFINTSDNIRLDKNYTVFAQVVEGMDVVIKLAHGDQIIVVITN